MQLVITTLHECEPPHTSITSNYTISNRALADKFDLFVLSPDYISLPLQWIQKFYEVMHSSDRMIRRGWRAIVQKCYSCCIACWTNPRPYNVRFINFHRCSKKICLYFVFIDSCHVVKSEGSIWSGSINACVIVREKKKSGKLSLPEYGMFGFS